MAFGIADGVALAAFGLGLCGYLINGWQDRRTRAANRRTEAYLDYIRSQNMMAVIKDDRDPEFQRMDALHLDARARILLYGSSTVIDSLRHLKSGNRSFMHPQTLVSYVALLSAMRKDLVGGALTKEEVGRILVFDQGEELPSHVFDPLLRK